MPAPRVLLLDRVTDPHNVGAILRSAEVLGASAVIGTRHHSAPETGALAKTASGALERQPYLRVRNLADAIRELQNMGYLVLGLDGEAEHDDRSRASRASATGPWRWCWGPKGRGCAKRPRKPCDALVRIDAAGRFGSLNVSNAAAIALYAVRTKTAEADAWTYPTKIATCCYCGSRAALTLDEGRHELACASCGAPLRDLKMLPKAADAAPDRASATGPLRQFPRQAKAEPVTKSKPRR